MVDSSLTELTKDKKEKVRNWIEKKWTAKGKKCECCNCVHWSLYPDFVAPNNFNDYENVYPFVMVCCQNCGNAKIFNAVRMGLLDEWNKSVNTFPKKKMRNHRLSRKIN